jgi:hypothetical protein
LLLDSLWFESPISGYIYLKLENENEIKGGWWYTEDVAEEIIKNLSKFNDSLRRMNQLLLKRDTTSTKFPGFIEEYFKRE